MSKSHHIILKMVSETYILLIQNTGHTFSSNIKSHFLLIFLHFSLSSNEM